MDAVHWCVLSNIGCQDGVVNVYDSLFKTLAPSIVPVIASLVFTTLTKLTIRMVGVQTQGNSSDCGVLAIAMAHDICAGHDPGRVVYDPDRIRSHLMACLESSRIWRFPVTGEERTRSIITSSQTVDLHCSCRMPEEDNVEMAECDTCKNWYHKHCMNIPNEVFSEQEVHWECKNCKGL